MHFGLSWIGLVSRTYLSILDFHPVAPLYGLEFLLRLRGPRCFALLVGFGYGGGDGGIFDLGVGELNAEESGGEIFVIVCHAVMLVCCVFMWCATERSYLTTVVRNG